MTLRRRDRGGRAFGVGSLGALVAALAAGLLAVPAAEAEDTFYVRNETGEALVPDDQDALEENCWFDATGVFDAAGGASAAAVSSISSEEHVFECEAGWGSNIGYEVKPRLGKEHGEWSLRGGGQVGAIQFGALDPLIGSATLFCRALGAQWAEANSLIPIEGFMTAEADGLTCKVRVEVFGLGHARHRVTVTLRDRSGRRIGAGTRILSVGDRSRVVPVALLPSASRELSARHELRVEAAAEISSSGGTGDETTQLVLRRDLGRP